MVRNTVSVSVQGWSHIYACSMSVRVCNLHCFLVIHLYFLLRSWVLYPNLSLAKCTCSCLFKFGSILGQFGSHMALGAAFLLLSACALFYGPTTSLPCCDYFLLMKLGHVSCEYSVTVSIIVSLVAIL